MGSFTIIINILTKEGKQTIALGYCLFSFFFIFSFNPLLIDYCITNIEYKNTLPKINSEEYNKLSKRLMQTQLVIVTYHYYHYLVYFGLKLLNKH